MLVLFETPAGYAIFKVSIWLFLVIRKCCFGVATGVARSCCWSIAKYSSKLKTYNQMLLCYDQLLDEKKLQQIDDLYKDFETPDAASKV